MKERVFIFDLDDTLLECNKNYCKIISQFVCDMVDEFKTSTPHPASIANQQMKIDKELVHKRGFEKDRFPLSLVKTYQYFHELHFPGKQYNSKFIRDLYKLGYSVYDIIPKELPNSINLLQKLNDLNIPIYLLTAGEFEPQYYKIKNTNIQHYFKKENIFINVRKGVDEFSLVINKILKDHPHVELKDITMIGDSLRNDIKPALDIGINAIHLNVASWSVNNIDITQNFKSLNNLYELEQHIF